MEWLSLANRVLRRQLGWAGVQSQVTRLDGVEVHYYRARGQGSGPPVLLVHGLGSSAHAFIRTFSKLRSLFREVYAIDLPGNGFSPNPVGGALSLEAHVEVLLQFRREIIRQPVLLVGNSLGGGMALDVAMEEPDSLLGLVLVSPAGAWVSEARFTQLVDSFRVSTVGEARRLAHQLFAKPSLGLLLFADELRKMVNTPAVHEVITHSSVADLFKPEELAKISMPTLLIWGQREKLLPYEGLDYFRAHLPPHVEIHEVKRFGHMPQMEHPAEFLRRLEAFARARGLVPAS